MQEGEEDDELDYAAADEVNPNPNALGGEVSPSP